MSQNEIILNISSLKNTRSESVLNLMFFGEEWSVFADVSKYHETYQRVYIATLRTDIYI